MDINFPHSVFSDLSYIRLLTPPLVQYIVGLHGNINNIGERSMQVFN